MTVDVVSPVLNNTIYVKWKYVIYKKNERLIILFRPISKRNAKWYCVG